MLGLLKEALRTRGLRRPKSVMMSYSIFSVQVACTTKASIDRNCERMHGRIELNDPLDHPC